MAFRRVHTSTTASLLACSKCANLSPISWLSKI